MFELVANRHAAHRRVAGDLVLDAGDIGFARYTRFSLPKPLWKLGQTVDGARAAVAERYATLEVPLTIDQVASVRRLVAFVHAEAGQMLALKANGKPASKDEHRQAGRRMADRSWCRSTTAASAPARTSSRSRRNT